MTLNDFMELCEKNHLQAEEYSKNWYIANIKSKYIKATWIICYCTTDEKTVLPKDISTDGNTITYNGKVYTSTIKVYVQNVITPNTPEVSEKEEVVPPEDQPVTPTE